MHALSATAESLISFNTHPELVQLTGHNVLRPPTSARTAYAAASLPPTAPDHVTLQTYRRSSASVLGSSQRYSVWQISSIDYFLVHRVGLLVVNRGMATTNQNDDERQLM